MKSVAILLSAMIAAVCACRPGANGIEVELRNLCARSVSNVAVSFTGGTNFVDGISPGAVWKSQVYPSGESILALEFLDADGAVVQTNIGSFIEPGYRGTVTILVSPTNRVTWVDRVRVGL